MSKDSQLSRLSDKEVFAHTIYGEARDQKKKVGLPGWTWPAWVIKNRARYNEGYWGGDSIRRVCLHPGQFECWNDGIWQKWIPIKEKRTYEDIRRVTDQIFDQRWSPQADPTHGSDHYHNPENEKRPSWVGKCAHNMKSEARKRGDMKLMIMITVTHMFSMLNFLNDLILTIIFDNIDAELTALNSFWQGNVFQFIFRALMGLVVIGFNWPAKVPKKTMNNFIYPNDSLAKFGLDVYDSLHPGLLQTFANQCNSELMQTRPNLIKGIIYVLIGTTYEILYLLCMIAMCQPKFLAIICYQILFVIGFFDMLSMISNSLLPGYWLITGQSFCRSPMLNLSIGASAFPCWATYSALSISLAINRCVDFTFPNKQEMIFGGKAIILWTGLPIVYGLILYLKVPSVVYHAPTASYYFGADPMKAQAPFIFTINNIFMAILILFLNVIMIRAMLYRNLISMTKTQRMIAFQCFGISMSVLLTGWLYVAMQFLPMPNFMITVANLCWQFSNGSMAIFYLTVNKTMRKEVLKLLRIPRKNNRIYSTSTGPQAPKHNLSPPNC
ncbi:unnamed protein product, partial [Mesorhabditis belari]|uniref:Cell wall hydrolase SleB domain-containing protein n=1 Tax=Mesorhabditis belari TaxID=2138241 RepID=A0AAF3ECF6_9BILA